jgi:hypothetical protein
MGALAERCHLQKISGLFVLDFVTQRNQQGVVAREIALLDRSLNLGKAICNFFIALKNHGPL